MEKERRDVKISWAKSCSQTVFLLSALGWFVYKYYLSSILNLLQLWVVHAMVFILMEKQIPLHNEKIFYTFKGWFSLATESELES